MSGRNNQPTNNDLYKLIKTNFDKLLFDIEKVTNTMEQLSGKMVVLDDRVTKLEAENNNIKDIINNIKSPLLDIENLQVEVRKMNLIIVGLNEQTNETEADIREKISHLFVNNVLIFLG